MMMKTGSLALWQKDLLKLAALALVCTGVVAITVSFALSPMSAEDWEQLQLPTTFDKAKQLKSALRNFQQDHPWGLFLAFATVYLWLKTFAIPGTGIVNVLGGALFGFPLAMGLGVTFATVGAVNLYFISYLFCRRVLEYYFPEKLAEFKKLIQQSDNLFLRLSSIRIFPFMPHWFVSLACGQLQVPLLDFAVSSFIGQIPYTFLGCHAGTVLKDMSSMADVMKPPVMIALASAAVVGFALPAVLKKLGLAPERPPPATKENGEKKGA